MSWGSSRTKPPAWAMPYQYDMHASMGYMMHLAVADNTGRSVVVEYINNDLMDTLAAHDAMTTDKVWDALDNVSKDNFNEFESTEWSVVYNQDAGTARYYHRENYAENHTFQVRSGG